MTAAAPLAREAAVMGQSLRLAHWLAQSPRPVTAGQVLRPADVAAAGAALGVRVPARVRTAADVPALHRPWSVAVATGLVTIDAGCVYEWFSGPDLQSRIALLADSDHPDAGALAQALTKFVDSGEPRTADQVLQLKVTLTGTQPPVWRRVLVRATADLEDLHRIIQVLFGWDGDHLHVFDVGGRRYTDPYFVLDDPAIRSEFDLRLAAAFTPSVRKIRYTYDFGACWRHEITLEKVVEGTPGQDDPVCIAFKGDSPVEYWSEGDPQDQEPFDLAAVNQRLARGQGDDDEDDDDE